MRRVSRLLLTTTLFCGLFYVREVCAQKPGTAPSSNKAPVADSLRGAQKIVVQGVEVEFTITPLAANNTQAGELMEEQDALLRFRVTDAATKTPWTGVRPAVWIARRDEGEPDPKLCREKIQTYLQGTLRARPDVDLNSYFLLALNQEANISVIDPILGFGGSKLVTLVLLPSPGEDWVITKDQARLFVSMPAVNQVAIVDTHTWKVVAKVDTRAKPVRLALQPDERYLWVGTEEGSDSGVTVIDTAGAKVAAHIPTGAGSHEIVVDDNNKLAYVTNRVAGTLTIVDVQKLARIADLKLAQPLTSVAFSPLSKSVYVSNSDAGHVSVIDGRKRKVVARIGVEPGVNRVRFAPGGRYGFATNPSAGSVYIFDAASSRLLHTVPVGKTPDQITFTKDFAYVRLADAVEVVMIRLSTIEKDPDVLRFPGGQKSISESKTARSVADAIVPTPEGNSVVVANTADRQIYYYTEGMAAPMGNFQNYRRDPRAVLVADRSLRETRTGVYEAVTRMPGAGAYHVAFLLDGPRIAHCFEARAINDPTVKGKRGPTVRIEYLKNSETLRPGVDYKLRFRLLDTATNGPKSSLKDVHVLTFLAPGLWQKRAFAREVGDGLYELTINVPEPGVYMIFVETKSQGITFRDLPPLTLHGQTATPATLPAALQ